jgi:sialate O-acetylesterase
MHKVLFILFSAAWINLNAQNMPIRLPSIISDHAVFQQSATIKLWGWGPATLEISIVSSWAPTDTVKALVAKDCTWKTTLETPEAGGTHSIEFSCGNNKQIISDIVLGEVWLCSGQSNIEMPISKIPDFNVSKYRFDNTIRIFQVEQSHDIYLHSDSKGKWIVCDSNSVKQFSAVAFFFGSNLREKLQTPAGLIVSSWGATSIQPWIPRTAFANEEELSRESHFGTAWAPQETSILYNTMIHPLAPYKIAGVIWYQGESNALKMEEALNYGKLLKNMIQCWRAAFENDFPFYFVQIAPFDGYYPKDAAAYLREQQELTLSVPKTGMVAIGDLVDNVKDIHPLLKTGVGYRLANLALKEVYGFQDIMPYSPKFAGLKIDKNKARIAVSSIGKLSCKGDSINSFRIAGEDKVFYQAKAVLTEEGEIILQSDKVKKPVAVRYCFSNEEIPNLFDINGLPLLAFRTDN